MCRIYRTQIYRWIQHLKTYSLEQPQLVPFSTFSVSEDQGLLCIDIEVSSPLHGTWIRPSRGDMPRARQSSEFAPEIGGTACIMANGGTAVAPVHPEVPELSIGMSIAFHPQNAPPPDRLYPVQTDSARPCIGRPRAFQSSKNEKDNSEPLQIPIGEFTRAKNDLHEDCTIKAAFPRRSRHLSVAVSHTES